MPVFTITELDKAQLSFRCIQSTVYLEAPGRREEVGWGIAMLAPCDAELHLFRLDVVKQHRGKGYGFAQVFAILQRALSLGLPGTTRIRAIADEAETPQLRRYCARIGFSEEEFQEGQDPEQYSMSASLELILLHLRMELRKYGDIRYLSW